MGGSQRSEVRGQRFRHPTSDIRTISTELHSGAHMDSNKRHLLLILDGYGIAEDPSVSAIDHAKKPYLDYLFSTYPHARLEASGRAVGLPEGQMGNSEVGHTNLGAGRIVYQEITRIDKSLEDGAFFTNAAFTRALDRVVKEDRRHHLLGLVSVGGVPVNYRHLARLLELARRRGARPDQVVIHAITDGRDTPPRSALHFLGVLERDIAAEGVGRIATVCGRYYAMDRDKRWERTALAYEL